MNESHFSMSEVLNHNRSNDAWTVVGGRVYDLTDFVNKHPGGYSAIMRAVGREGTSVFCKFSII